MNIYDISNINNCEVQEIGNPIIGHRLFTKEDWYIHLNDGFEDSKNDYKTCVVLFNDYDYSNVEIIHKDDLPEEAVIC